MVPEGWVSKKLGSMSSLVTSGSRDWARFYSDTGSKFIRMTNLRRDGIHLKMDDMKFVDVASDSADGKRTSLQAGDILISITAELGKIGWVPLGLGEAYINQHTALVRVKPVDAVSMFIAYLLCSKPYHRRINALNDAGAKAGLNLATIRSLPIDLPPLPEQKKIAQIFSTWDQAITATERLLENSQQRKKGLMQQLLTGKKRLPGFEGEWEEFLIAELEDKGWLKLGRGKVISKTDIENKPGQYPIYSSSIKNDGLMGAYGEFMFDEELISWSVDGGGNFFYRPKHKFSVTNVSGYMRLDTDRLSYKFLAEQLGYLHERQAFNYQTKAHPSVIRKLYRVKIPSLREQQKIAQVLAVTDAEVAANQVRLECLKEEKKALMQQLLTGKRRVQVDTEAA